MPHHYYYVVLLLGSTVYSTTGKGERERARERPGFVQFFFPPFVSSSSSHSR